jgi:hypothetical protein
VSFGMLEDVSGISEVKQNFTNDGKSEGSGGTSDLVVNDDVC